MSYNLTIDKKQNYWQATVTGQNSRQNVEAYLADLLAQCQAADCRQLLIEERLEGPRLNTLEVFEIAAQGSAQSLGRFKAIAYVDTNAEGDLMQFAETVAVNRALPVRVFTSLDEANKWLCSQT